MRFSKKSKSPRKVDKRTQTRPRRHCVFVGQGESKRTFSSRNLVKSSNYRDETAVFEKQCRTYVLGARREPHQKQAKRSRHSLLLMKSHIRVLTKNEKTIILLFTVRPWKSSKTRRETQLFDDDVGRYLCFSLLRRKARPSEVSIPLDKNRGFLIF